MVDSHSTDGTPELAARHAGVAVVPFRWSGTEPKKKQWCLDTLPFACRWVLFVDADERVPLRLVHEIAAAVAAPGPHAAFWVRGRPHFLGHRLRFVLQHRKIVLLDRGR